MPIKLSASVIGRAMTCTASADLETAIPGWTPPVRDDNAGAKGTGSRIHLGLEHLFKDLTSSQLPQLIKLLDYVHGVASTRRFRKLVEEPMVAEWLTSRPVTTPDLVLYLSDELHIFDWKWGRLPVDVIDNPQLMFAAVSCAHLAPKAQQVTVHLLQPPLDKFESQVLTAAQLAVFSLKVREAEQLIHSKQLTFVPSDHCTFCPANPHSRGDKNRPYCPAMMKMLYPEFIDEAEILG